MNCDQGPIPCKICENGKLQFTVMNRFEKPIPVLGRVFNYASTIGMVFGIFTPFIFAHGNESSLGLLAQAFAILFTSLFVWAIAEVLESKKKLLCCDNCRVAFMAE